MAKALSTAASSRCITGMPMQIAYGLKATCKNMGISKIATSMSLSEVLLATGVDRKTADMFYPHPIDSGFPEVCDEGDNEQVDYPAWSLDALINLLVGWDVVFYVDEHLMWHCHCWRMVGKSREDISQCDFGKIEAICRVIVYLKNRGEI